MYESIKQEEVKAAHIMHTHTHTHASGNGPTPKPRLPESERDAQDVISVP